MAEIKNKLSTDILPLGGQFYKTSLDIGDLPGLNVGTESMFNKYSVFSLSKVTQITNSGDYRPDLHLDIKAIINPVEFENVDIINDNFNNTEDFKSANSQYPTTAKIIEQSKATGTDGIAGHFPYSWADFLYCKYYNKVQNNSLITLRRYPVPIHDNAQSPDDNLLVPVAQAVTFFGENTGNKLSDIMKFSYGLIWTEIESEVQDVDGNEKGFGSGIEGALTGSKLTSKMGSLTAFARGSSALGRWDGSAQKEQEWLKSAWSDKGPYWNQVYGPVNVVHKTYKRDRGMNFKQDIKLKFTYSLRSINGVNPKVAMLDIMSNFLLLTYNNAKFFGGMTRYYPNFQDAVGFLGDQSAFYNGNWGGYFESVKNELESLGKTLMSSIGKTLSGDLSAIKELAGNALGMAMGKLAKQTRPHILSIRNLLTGAPIGEWHLTIGNPLDPIAVMGNMLVDNVEVEFSDILGADDFPNEISFIVSLKHGRPRDLGDIESMFNMGMGKMSYSPLVKLPSEQNTHGDSSDKQRSKDYNKRNEFSESTKTMNTSQLVDKFLTTTESQSTYARVKGRLQSEWGEQYANSKHLVYLLSKTEAKF
jgi:hypothetical protein